MIEIRQVKGTANENARHVLAGGMLLFALIFAVAPGIGYVAEMLRMPETPITAEFEFQWDKGEPEIVYEPKPEWPVRAYFYIQTRDVAGVNVLQPTYRSTNRWSYSPVSAERREWPWDSWVEYGLEVPKQDFQLCIRYIGEGQFGVPFETKYQCNGPYRGAREGAQR